MVLGIETLSLCATFVSIPYTQYSIPKEAREARKEQPSYDSQKQNQVNQTEHDYAENIVNKNKKHIFLIGFMATGKTTIGKKAAKKSGLPFFDLDHCITEWEQQSIPEIFAQKGEDYFREIESKVLQNFVYQEASFVATGGGTPCYNNNMEFILENGWSVYLKTSTDRLYGRLRQQRGKRPLVNSLTDEELRTFIENKIAERSPFYEQADFVVDNDGKVPQLVKEIEELFS